MYLEDIDDDDNPGIHHGDYMNTPTKNKYDDMTLKTRPDDDDEEAIHKYLNVELIMNVGTNDERCGHIVKHSQGLDGEPIN